MTTNSEIRNWVTKGMRWSARVVALLANGLFVLFLVESGPRVIPELSWSSPQGMPLLLAMIVAAVGMLIAWRWEMVGGAMAVGAAVAIAVLVLLGSGTVLLRATIIMILPLLVSGALFIVCYRRSRPSPPAEEVLIKEAYANNGVVLSAKSR